MIKTIRKRKNRKENRWKKDITMYTPVATEITQEPGELQDPYPMNSPHAGRQTVPLAAKEKRGVLIFQP